MTVALVIVPTLVVLVAGVVAWWWLTREARAEAGTATAVEQPVVNLAADSPYAPIVAEIRATRGELGAVRAKFRSRDVALAVAGVGIALDLTLTAGLAWVGHQIGERSSASVVNCRAINQIAQSMQDIFGPFYDPEAPLPNDAAQRKATIAFRELTQNRPDCDNLR